MSPDWSAKEEPVPYAKLDDPQTLNLYSYVGNNPLARADADGHCFPFCLALAGGGALLADEAPLALTGPVGWTVNGVTAVGVIGVAAYEHFHQDAPAPAVTPAPATTPSPSQSTPASPPPPDNGNKKTEHGQKRADEARSGDSHREVGDANRVKAEGKTYTDSDTGNTVHVKGSRVVITDSEGNQVTQFKNSRANTAQRVQDGKWVPNK